MNYLSIIVAVLLVGILVFLTYHRPNKKRRYLRVVASGMAVMGLLLLVLPILPNDSYDNGVEVIVLTEGYHQDSVDAFVKKRANPLKQIYIEDKEMSQIIKGTIAHVFGYGFKEPSTHILSSTKIIFHPSPLPNGFGHVEWSEKIELGQTFSLQATVVNTNKQPLQLYLQSTQKMLDSISIMPNGLTPINLSAVPNNLGRGIYQLVLREGKKVLANELVPFIVTEPEPVDILVLSEAPSFEAKFLKNWLSDNGNRVATRTRISKQVFEQGFSNRKPTSLEKITAQLLNQFQVVVADESAILSLSDGERNALKNQVQLKGLGLVLKCDTILKKSTIPASPFLLKSINETLPFSASLHMKGMDTSWHPSIQTNQFLEKANHQGTQSLVIDQLGRILVGMTKWERGSIIVSALNNSYTWMLKGNKEAYGSYWTQLLQRSIATNVQAEHWGISTKIPRVGESTTINLEKNDPNTPIAIIQLDEVYLKQMATQPFLMKGSYWPSRVGWQSIISTNGLNTSWYVFDQQQWEGLEAKSRIQQTLKFVQQSSLGKAPQSSLAKKNYALFPVFWAMIILLTGLLVLWVEAKLD